VKNTFQTGLDQLYQTHSESLCNKRVGLVAHPASLTRDGRHADQVVSGLVALFGPEHGYFGFGGAGEIIADGQHPVLELPIRSLYGDHRRPTEEMLKDLDVIVIDLQDLAVRCYTFCTTIRYVMEAAAEYGKSVVVLDRAIPLPNTLDGPLVKAGFESFVSGIDAPLLYGMTPGETARWIKDTYALDVDLEVVPMQNYQRVPAHEQVGVPWVPPSPGIRSWETAYVYTTTVFTEALPDLRCDRTGTLPFQLLYGPWTKGRELAERLNLPGARVEIDWRKEDGEVYEGIRIIPYDLTLWRPVSAAVFILAALQNLVGVDKVWRHEGVRENFFDLLMGSDEPRLQLQGNESPEKIVNGWEGSISTFNKQRTSCLLY
jgi:uncharacterized protein YbbC (DUF1343 family)